MKGFQKIKEKVAGIIAKTFAILFLAAMFLAILAAVSAFSFMVMKIFEVEYASYGNVVLFFIAVEVFGMPLELLSSILPRVMVRFGIVSEYSSKVIFFLMDMLSTAVVMYIVDGIMLGIKIAEISIVVVSALAAFISLRLMDKKYSL